MAPCDNLRKTPSTCDGETWWGSSYGEDLDVAAPGVKIYTTDIQGSGGFNDGQGSDLQDPDYTQLFNGTSSSCPMAAATAALMLTIHPDLSVSDLRTALQSSADKVGGYDYNWNPVRPGHSLDLGYGRTNAYNAIIRGVSTTPQRSLDLDATGPGNVRKVAAALEHIYIPGLGTVTYYDKYFLFANSGDILLTKFRDGEFISQELLPGSEVTWPTTRLISYAPALGSYHRPALNFFDDEYSLFGVWYEEITPGYYDLDFSYNILSGDHNSGGWQNSGFWPANGYTNLTTPPNPTILAAANIMFPDVSNPPYWPPELMVVFQKTDGLYYLTGTFSPLANKYGWYDPVKIPFTGHLNHNPSLSEAKNHLTVMAYQEDNTPTEGPFSTIIRTAEWDESDWSLYTQQVSDWPNVINNQDCQVTSDTINSSIYYAWKGQDVFRSSGCVNVRKRNWDYEWSVIKEVVISGSSVQQISGPTITAQPEGRSYVLYSDPNNNIWEYSPNFGGFELPPTTIYSGGKHPNAIEHNECTYMYTDISGSPYEVKTHIPSGSPEALKVKENLGSNARYFRRISAHNRNKDFYVSLELSEISINSGANRVSFNGLPQFFSNGDTLFTNLHHHLNTRLFYTADSIHKLSFDLNFNFQNFQRILPGIELKVHVIDAASHQPLAILFSKSIQNDSTLHETIEYDLPSQLKRKSVYLRPLLSSAVRIGLPQMIAQITEVTVLSDGTEQFAIYKNPTSESGSSVPDKFSLSQNYPNPFNPNTAIHFSLPQNARVELIVFDITGRKVRILADRNFDKGSHAIFWDGRNEHKKEVASGIYIYRLTASLPANKKTIFQQSRRMILVR